MDVDRIRDLIVQRVKASPAMRKSIHRDDEGAPESLKAEDLAGFEPWLANPDLKEYLTECLVPGGYIASGIPVHDLPTIRGSIVEGCSPGGFIFSFGYLVIASGIGGDEVCVGTDGGVYWAGHETFADSITYQDPETGALEDWEYTPENVRRALIRLCDSFEPFLVSFLTDQLEERLEALD